MSKATGGGPAFPIPGQEFAGGYLDPSDGMTLRDYFAAKALASTISQLNRTNYKESADKAYAYADAMLAARGES